MQTVLFMIFSRWCRWRPEAGSANVEASLGRAQVTVRFPQICPGSLLLVLYGSQCEKSTSYRSFRQICTGSLLLLFPAQKSPVDKFNFGDKYRIVVGIVRSETHAVTKVRIILELPSLTCALPTGVGDHTSVSCGISNSMYQFLAGHPY